MALACGAEEVFECGTRAPAPEVVLRPEATVLAQSGAALGTWSYVGEGHGEYREVRYMEYVGPHAGGFNKEVARPPRRCFWLQIVLLLFIVALLAGLISWWALRTSFSPARRDRLPELPPPTCRSFECPQNYMVDPGQGFDCDAGLDTYEGGQGWSHQKRVWCCLHQDKGCDGRPALSTEACCAPTCAVYQCPHGYLEQGFHGSGYASYETCCKTEPRCKGYTCPSGYMQYHSHFAAEFLTDEECCRPTCSTFTCPAGSYERGAHYDCNAGLANFQNGWSEHKKLWCCAQEGKGCTSHAVAVSYETCCHAEPTCGSYACPHGYFRDACATASTELHTHSCCRPTCQTFKCPSGYRPFGQFDCQAGLSNWRAGWSSSKKAWCCAHEGLGCGETCSSMPDINVQTCCHHVPTSHSCKLWGDPHIITFDQSHLVFYSTGDFWIVKSEQLKIQGRFQCTDWTASHDKTDYSSMTAIIVSGPIIDHHVIEVQTADGQILCDRKAILPGFGSAECGSAKIEYNGVGELVDDAMAFLPHKVVHLTLPNGVSLQLNRWPNFMNAKIDMPPQAGGQDGVCGNFNGRATDDTGIELHRRYGKGIAVGELLFDKGIPLHVPQAPPSPTRCSEERHARAAHICRQESADEEMGWSFAECMGDVCDEEKAGHGMFSWQAQAMKSEFQNA
eukprot:gb/GFBE01043610.1/.p1 GENE.gb/GFBE01043610.1/~~gb/GFBE01043610.1/.p1  ORF type:complete len:676 (+),score=120.12 gb/GFBE01043610.1/:1-2028(+)